jgi:hypothetical protein
VLRCESGLKWWAYNPADTDGKPRYGIAQYAPSTFYGFAEEWRKIYGEREFDIESPADQVEVMAFSFSREWQYHWGCWKE